MMRFGWALAAFMLYYSELSTDDAFIPIHPSTQILGYLYPRMQTHFSSLKHKHVHKYTYTYTYTYTCTYTYAYTHTHIHIHTHTNP